MSGKVGVDNGDITSKAQMRQRAARSLPSAALVLEACTGDGKLYDAAWFRFRGVTCDINVDKVSTAARTRPGWLCIHGDSTLLAEAGAFDAVPFAVVDLDYYGSPWPACLAYIRTHTAWPDVTHVFLTDGYAVRANMAGQDRALFPGVGRSARTTTAQVFEQAQRVIADEASKHGLDADVLASVTHSSVSYHHIALTRGPS